MDLIQLKERLSKVKNELNSVNSQDSLKNVIIALELADNDLNSALENVMFEFSQSLSSGEGDSDFLNNRVNELRSLKEELSKVITEAKNKKF